MRSAVGLLTRNIKIKKGADAHNWGCRILAYGMADGDKIRVGNLFIHNV